MYALFQAWAGTPGELLLLAGLLWQVQRLHRAVSHFHFRTLESKNPQSLASRLHAVELKVRR